MKKIRKIPYINFFFCKTYCKKSKNVNETKANASKKTPGNSRAI